MLGIAPEQLFDELLKAVPPGSMGLMLQPYWSPGIREPGPEAKGALIGFGDVHQRAHVYRALIEGLAYALLEGRERLERRNGVKMQRLRVSGGGAIPTPVSRGVFKNVPPVKAAVSENPRDHRLSAVRCLQWCDS